MSVARTRFRSTYGNFAYQTKSFVSPTLATKLRKAQKGDLIIATTSENIEDVCKPLVWLGTDEVYKIINAYRIRVNKKPLIFGSNYNNVLPHYALANIIITI